MGFVHTDYTYQYDQLKQQEDINKAVEDYKKELLEIITREEMDFNHYLNFEFLDDVQGGTEYIFDRLKKFINSGSLPPREWESCAEAEERRKINGRCK